MDHLHTIYGPYTHHQWNINTPSMDHLHYIHLWTIYTPSIDHLHTIYGPSTLHLWTIYTPSMYHKQNTRHLWTIKTISMDHLHTVYVPKNLHLRTNFSIINGPSIIAMSIYVNSRHDMQEDSFRIMKYY